MSNALSSRGIRTMVLLAVLTISVVVLLPRPALGCTCLSGFERLLDQMPAAFVGSASGSVPVDDEPDSRPTKVIRFEVEQWIKGDLGEVIEVRAEDDREWQSSCGSMPDFGRVGLFLSVDEQGELWGHPCGLMESDLMKAMAAGPELSSTGIPKVMLAKWGSAVLTVLDAHGDLVALLDPRTDTGDIWSIHRHDLCPGARLLVQADAKVLTTWNLDTFTIASRIDLADLNLGDPGQLFCRDEDARSVWMTTGVPGRVEVIDVFTGDHILTTEAHGVQIGGSHLITTDESQTTVIRTDLETGESVTLHEGDEPSSVFGTPNPVNGTTAVLERRVDDNTGRTSSTLLIYDDTGSAGLEFELPGSVDWVTWRDVNAVVAVVPTYGYNTVFLIDTQTGFFSVVNSWPAREAVGRGVEIFGTTLDGELWHGDTNTGFYSHIGSIPEASATYVLASFNDAAPIEVDPTLGKLPTEMSVPALTLDDLRILQEEAAGKADPPLPIPVLPPVVPGNTESSDPSILARVTFVGLVGALGVTLAILGVRKGKTRRSTQDEGDIG